MPNKLSVLQPEPNFKIIGHRGASGLAPENTLASFELAAKLGLNWVEFDTLRTATGEWVVIHDDTLDRTTNGTGRVDSVSYEYIKTLNNPIQKIPLLEEVLQHLLAWGVHPNIEIKSMQGNPDSLMQEFSELLQNYWPKTHPPPFISSFDLNLLQALQHHQPFLPLGYIIEKFSEDALIKTLQFGFKSLHCDYRYMQAADFAKAKAHNVPILLYTINTPELYHQFLKQEEVIAVFSDYPNLLKGSGVRHHVTPTPSLPRETGEGA